MFRFYFLSAFVIVLLLMYVYSTAHALLFYLCINDKFDFVCNLHPLTDGVKWTLTFVGGLMSTLVISILAITTSKQSPATAIIQVVENYNTENKLDPGSTQEKFITLLTNIYLVVWFVCGLTIVCFVFFLNFSIDVPELSSAAKSWTGMAIGAAYALFGIKPATEGK
ncbi:hypothetical protein [Dyadobacter sp. 3J3]|uniref:hypothetical protein n=1 Tax=Dyadobacter sp. 3J3 TaxID=2606600 RepID=UPI00135B0B36|nr:hypothetical protein [Dyadobacter sp. 3J3]